MSNGEELSGAELWIMRTAYILVPATAVFFLVYRYIQK